MTIKELIEKMQEVKGLVEDTKGLTQYDKDNLAKIFRICENALYDYRVDEAVKRLEK